MMKLFKKSNTPIDDGWEKIINDAGYSYDWQQDIFYSRMDAWQRKYGYCPLYDEAAAPLSMVFDCEPVKFDYEGKKWLIELWKGQYGITTGGEIGVYTADTPTIKIPGVFYGAFYSCASDEDRLPLSFTLLKNDTPLFKRMDNHWWLTGFILGEFSEPKELVMKAAISLKDYEMCNAFVAALKEIGYTDEEIDIANNTVSITFAKPRSKQPLSRARLISGVSQMKNKYLCKRFKSLTEGLENMPDIMAAIKQKAPDLYNLILNIGKPSNLFKRHEPIVRFLDKKKS